MAIAQQLEQKGIQPRRLECRNEGKLEVARTMLHNGIDSNAIITMTGLTECDLAQIHH